MHPKSNENDFLTNSFITKYKTINYKNTNKNTTVNLHPLRLNMISVALPFFVADLKAFMWKETVQSSCHDRLDLLNGTKNCVPSNGFLLWGTKKEHKAPSQCIWVALSQRGFHHSVILLSPLNAIHQQLFISSLVMLSGLGMYFYSYVV